MLIVSDTSALLKLYVEEPGAQRVEAVFREASRIAVSVLCSVEVIATLNRKVREGVLSTGDYADIKAAFASDWTQLTVVDLSASLLDITFDVLERTPTRTLDAIHIATASILEADRFVTSDCRQADAAVSLGLTVERIEA